MLQARALAACATLALLALPSPASAVAAAGVGSAVFPGCPADTVPVVGAENGPTTWTFAIGDAHVSPSVGCTWIDGSVVQGTFTRAAGGCLSGLAATACFTSPVAISADETRYNLVVDLPLGPAIAGTVTLLFA